MKANLEELRVNHEIDAIIRKTKIEIAVIVVVGLVSMVGLGSLLILALKH